MSCGMRALQYKWLMTGISSIDSIEGIEEQEESGKDRKKKNRSSLFGVI